MIIELVSKKWLFDCLDMKYSSQKTSCFSYVSAVINIDLACVLLRALIPLKEDVFLIRVVGLLEER